MVTMAQSAANWRNTRTHVDRTHSLTHLHQHSYDHFLGSASSAIYRIWNRISILKAWFTHIQSRSQNCHRFVWWFYVCLMTILRFRHTLQSTKLWRGLDGIFNVRTWSFFSVPVYTRGFGHTDKATNGQTDIKHDKDFKKPNKLCLMSLLKIAVEKLPPSAKIEF